MSAPGVHRTSPQLPGLAMRQLAPMSAGFPAWCPTVDCPSVPLQKADSPTRLSRYVQQRGRHSLLPVPRWRARWAKLLAARTSLAAMGGFGRYQYRTQPISRAQCRSTPQPWQSPTQETPPKPVALKPRTVPLKPRSKERAARQARRTTLSAKPVSEPKWERL